MANSNPAATVGVDEDGDVSNVQNPNIAGNPTTAGQNPSGSGATDVTEAALVTMVVLDGIVMGPQVCLKCH